MSPEVSPPIHAVSLCNHYEKYFVFKEHARYNGVPVAIDVPLLTSDHVRMLGIENQTNGFIASNLKKVILCIDEQGDIRFAEFFPEKSAKQMKEPTKISWPEAKRRIALRHLLKNNIVQPV